MEIGNCSYKNKKHLKYLISYIKRILTKEMKLTDNTCLKIGRTKIKINLTNP